MYYQEKDCCHDLPVGEHCKRCDDDERGDQLRDRERDRRIEEEWEQEA